jgi:glycosyltransferase involved in cell wall biosynthesis
MPVFNGAAYLAEAVESVLAQTYADLELVAVDDGSQDDSRAILEGYAERDSRVRLLANERNLGISATLNRGWREARGTYIARLDADDVALPDRLARQVEFLDNHPAVAVVGGAAIIIDATGRRGAIMRFPTRSAAIRSTLPRHNCLAHPSVTMRRAALEALGGYRFDHVEDYDLWLRISERFQLANLPDPVILYRRHVDQISFTALEEQVRRVLAVRKAARARLASHDDPLAEVSELTPAVLARMDLDSAELTRTLEHECLAWATTLAELNNHDEAEELVAQASRTLGHRAVKAFAAAGELQKAETLLGKGRPLAGATHVLIAFRREPRYAFSRLSAWLADHLRGRLPRLT